MCVVVECNNNDGLVDVLVVFWVKVFNIDLDVYEVGYCFWVWMVLDEGCYKIVKFDQVMK